MKITAFSVLILTFLLILSCNKPVYKYNPDFEGTWQTVPVYDSLLNYMSTSEIIIDGTEGAYKNSCKTCPDELCDCLSFQTGKAVMNDQKTQMRIGTNGTALVINEEPNIDSNGDWTMVIQGLRYYKQ